ncbi:MAG: hypothetical protein FK731_13875 [Asgard group archaeon]|nr:hypothetical protein [Asgard group archaeon]
MIRSKATLYSFILAVMIAIISSTPILLAQGETIQLINVNFYIEPSRPPLIAEGTFNITAEDDYVFGVLEEETTGSRSDTFTYYFEMYSTDHCEIYILDASGAFSQYSEYQTNFAGDAPTDYTYFYICDGYIQFNMTTAISPRLIIFTDGLDVTGSFFWTEGFEAIEYSPYYIRIKGGDYTTNDTIHIYNTNASVSAFILDEDNYDDYLLDPNIKPSSEDSVSYVDQSLNLYLNYQPEIYKTYHIFIWHEEFRDGVSGILTYDYSFQRTFLHNYWSLFLILILLVLVVLFTVFRKYTLPPVIWASHKLKKYLLEIPWKEIKAYFGDISNESKDILARMRGVSEIEEEEIEKVEVSPHNRLVISLTSLVFPISLHRFLSGKIGTGIVSLLLQGFTAMFIIGSRTQISVYMADKLLGIEEIANIALAVVFIILAIVLLTIYIIDVIAAFTGCFEDSKKRRILKW